MKDIKGRRLVLMITDSTGSRYLNIHAIYRQISFYVLLLVITLVIFGLISLPTLKAEITEMAELNTLITKRYSKILEKNTDLTQQINDRLEEISLVGDRIQDLEGIVGVQNDHVSQENLAYRVDVASLTGVQKSFTMKMIPNGAPMDTYRRVSAEFGYRTHPLMLVKHLHTGIDFSAQIDTPIYATADGVVDFASNGYNGGYGKLVKIEHYFGFKTYYAHLNKVMVKRGDFVKKGQIIGHSGNSGVSTGPHLHYEIRFLGNVVNPRGFVDWTMNNFYSIFENERNIAWQSLLARINSLMDQPTKIAEARR